MMTMKVFFINILVELTDRSFLSKSLIFCSILINLCCIFSNVVETSSRMSIVRYSGIQAFKDSPLKTIRASTSGFGIKRVWQSHKTSNLMYGKGNGVVFVQVKNYFWVYGYHILNNIHFFQSESQLA